MRFRLEQRIAGPLDRVARAYADPALYAVLGELPKLGRPEVLGRQEDGDKVRLQVRYRFTGTVSGAVGRVVDPTRLTWVEHSIHDLANHRIDFTLVPDHYRDRLRSRGHSSFHPDGNGTRRVCEGELVVSAFLVGPAAESAIVSGLREHLDAEVALVERFLDGSG